MSVGKTDDGRPVYPFRPRDWVFDGQRVAIVKGVWHDGTDLLLDLILYNGRTGEKIGRDSPAMGGPRTYEPACSADRWTRISQPTFPLSLKWEPCGDGKVTARLSAGKPLPPAQWSPPRRKVKPRFPRPLHDCPSEADVLRRALKAIKDGHNDPRKLAAIALGEKA